MARRRFKRRGYTTRRRGLTRRRYKRYPKKLYIQRRTNNSRIGGFFRHLALGGFPTKKTVALRYVEEFTLDPADATTASYVFRINNVYDPNLTGGGHQPMFYDNYSTLYSKYKVNSATISFRCMDNHVVNVATPNLVDGTNVGDNQYYAANQRASRMFIVKDEQANDYTTKINTLIEEGSKNLKWCFNPQNTSKSMTTLRMKCAPHQLCNLNFKDNSLEALIGGGPTRECYFICGVDSMPNRNSDPMVYQVIITYNVTFFDFKQNQSEN